MYRRRNMDDSDSSMRTPLLLADQDSMEEGNFRINTNYSSTSTTLVSSPPIMSTANGSLIANPTEVVANGCYHNLCPVIGDEQNSTYKRNISLTKNEPLESIIDIKHPNQQQQEQQITASISPSGTVETIIDNGTSTPTSTATHTKWMVFKGLFLAFISSIFFSLTTVIVKYLSEINPGQMAVFRFAGILLFSIPMALSCKSNPFGPKNLRFFLILRGIVGSSSLYFRYLSLHYIPIANATVIVLSMPIFVCVLGRIFLKEAFGLFHFIALTVTLVGISLTSKLNIIFGGGDDEQSNHDRMNDLFGLLSGLGAMLVGSFAYIIVRKVKGVDHSVILFNFAWVALIETSIITYFVDGYKVPDCGMAPWFLVILAVLSFYGQWLLTKALQAEEAGLVSVTRASSEVFFAFFFQIFIFKQLPDIYSIFGAILVTSAVVLTGIRKWVSTLEGQHWAKKIFAFTLK